MPLLSTISSFGVVRPEKVPVGWEMEEEWRSQPAAADLMLCVCYGCTLTCRQLSQVVRVKDAHLRLDLQPIKRAWLNGLHAACDKAANKQ